MTNKNHLEQIIMEKGNGNDGNREQLKTNRNVDWKKINEIMSKKYIEEIPDFIDKEKRENFISRKVYLSSIKKKKKEQNKKRSNVGEEYYKGGEEYYTKNGTVNIQKLNLLYCWQELEKEIKEIIDQRLNQIEQELNNLEKLGGIDLENYYNEYKKRASEKRVDSDVVLPSERGGLNFSDWQQQELERLYKEQKELRDKITNKVDENSKSEKVNDVNKKAENIEENKENKASNTDSVSELPTDKDNVKNNKIDLETVADILDIGVKKGDKANNINPEVELLNNENKEVINEVNKMPVAEKKTLFEGLANIGFRATEVKSRVIKNFLGKASNSKIAKDNSIIGRFFSQYAYKYQEKENSAKRMRKIIGKGKLLKLSGVGQGLDSTVGMVLKFGRIGFDVLNKSAVNPLRYVTMVGMIAGESMGVAKEVRFHNTEVQEKTLIIDKNEAYNQAMDILEKAKEYSGSKLATVENIERAYKEKLPEDLKNRLSKIDDLATSFLQKKLNKDIKYYVNNFERKINKIKENKRLSKTDKEKRINELFLRNADFLNDLDRMVGNAGIVDSIAYFSMAAEKTSKTVANLVVVDSLVRLASAGWDMLQLTEKYQDLLGYVKDKSLVEITKKMINNDDSATKNINNPIKNIDSPIKNIDSTTENIDNPTTPATDIPDKADLQSKTQNIEIKIGGRIDTFSEAIHEAVKKADPAVKDNFIHQVLGDNVVVSDESRQNLLHKAIIKLSIGEVYNNQEVPDLIYNGNNVILHQDGSWEVEKGDGDIKPSLTERQNTVSQKNNSLETNSVLSNFSNQVTSTNIMNETGVNSLDMPHLPDGGLEVEKDDGGIETSSIDAVRQEIDNLKRKLALEHFSDQGINARVMNEVGINSLDPNLLSDNVAMEKIRFLLNYKDNPEDFLKAIDALSMTQSAGVSYDDAFKYFDNYKSFNGDDVKIKAIIDLMKGNNIKKSLFSLTGVQATDENFEIKNGVVRFKDCFRDGFDFVMTIKNGEIRIGVDGPSRFNWNARGWWGNLRPNEMLTAQSLKDAKEATEKMSQDLEKS